jgi:DNA-binding LytR/AlgR family response regulator
MESILVVEDEPVIADDISIILERNGYNVSGMAQSAEEALGILNQSKPNLALLDINLEGKQDGIWLAHQINRLHKIPFVYLTSYYDEKTLARAQITDPYGYIVKPFDEGDLLANIKLSLVKNKYPVINETDKFFVRDKGKLKALSSKEILYAESDDNYTNIYTESARYAVTHTLKSVEEKLTQHGFIRVHKSYLINYKKITSISEGFVYINNQHLPIGRAYRDSLLGDLPIL